MIALPSPLRCGAAQTERVCVRAHLADAIAAVSRRDSQVMLTATRGLERGQKSSLRDTWKPVKTDLWGDEGDVPRQM